VNAFAAIKGEEPVQVATFMFALRGSPDASMRGVRPRFTQQSDLVLNSRTSKSAPRLRLMRDRKVFVDRSVKLGVNCKSHTVRERLSPGQLPRRNASPGIRDFRDIARKLRCAFRSVQSCRCEPNKQHKLASGKRFQQRGNPP